jgi:hypothetical protein
MTFISIGIQKNVQSNILVTPHVVELGHNKHKRTPHRKADKYLVTSAVVWLVLRTVNLEILLAIY